MTTDNARIVIHLAWRRKVTLGFESTGIEEKTELLPVTLAFLICEKGAYHNHEWTMDMVATAVNE